MFQPMSCKPGTFGPAMAVWLGNMRQVSEAEAELLAFRRAPGRRLQRGREKQVPRFLTTL